MKHSQQQNQKQLQKQGYFLSQQHLKLMHLMHLSGYALQEYLSNEVEQNPALEVETEIPVNDEADNGVDTVFDPELFDIEEDLFDRKNYQAPVNDYYEAPVMHFSSLQDNLKEQVQQMLLSENITDIAFYIIDELDEDGYLRLSLSDVCDDYGFAKGRVYEEKYFENALKAVQNCEPAGIGARDLRECLLIQLSKKLQQQHNCNACNRAMLILENHFELFTLRNFSKIKALLNIEEDDWNQSLHIITHLSPKPITETNKYELMREQIIPDFEVTIEDDEVYVSLSQSDTSKIKVNPDFSKTLHTHSNKEKKQAENYFSKLIEDAELLVMALKERETTMMKIITAIAGIQQVFFKTGDIRNLKPMILQDIALSSGYEISTISRTTSNKYVQTPFGIFALKNLFMRNINHDAASNSQHTAVGIQEQIKHIISNEDKSNPYSDNEITNQLQKQGMSIARRTVVKYREALGIANSSLRKTR